MTPTRPILRYHGGKWKLAPWIIDHFPPHRVYVEPYGGAASVLIRKQRSYAEVYNDLDGEIVELFRVLRERPRELAKALKWTPFSRDEYRLSFEPSEDPLEHARRTVIRSHMGFGSNAINRKVKSGFRSNSNRSGTTPAHDWINLSRNVLRIAKRFRGVVLENKPARAVMEQHDGPDTLHYLDPPYVHATRALDIMHGDHGYAHEMTDAEHSALAMFASGLEGMVVVSGYPSELYNEIYAGWQTVQCDALADKAGKRIEVLWFNRLAWERLEASRSQGGLFAAMGGFA